MWAGIERLCGCQLGRVNWCDPCVAGLDGVGLGRFQGLWLWGLAWGLPMVWCMAALVACLEE